MTRYLRLYLTFIRYEFSKATEFRLDFFFAIVMDACFYVMQILFFKILYQHTQYLGTWTEPQVLVFITGYLVVDAIQMATISYGLHMLPDHVNSGSFDYNLVRPVSSMFISIFKDFRVNSLVNLAMAIGLFCWALRTYPEPVSIGQILGYIALMMVGLVIFFSFRLLFILPVFWSHSGRGLEQLSYSCLQFMERPVTIFKGWVRIVLLTVIPMCVVTSIPARALFEGLTVQLVSHAVIVASAFLWLTLFVWNRALRAYSSASS